GAAGSCESSSQKACSGLQPCGRNNGKVCAVSGVNVPVASWKNEAGLNATSTDGSPRLIFPPLIGVKVSGCASRGVRRGLGMTSTWLLGSETSRQTGKY